jgi:hypothetical protein
MFEETNTNLPPMSARRKACLNQCRIQKYISGKTVFDGNCICDYPNQCWFNLTDKLDHDIIDPTMLWPDVKKIYIQWNEE